MKLIQSQLERKIDQNYQVLSDQLKWIEKTVSKHDDTIDHMEDLVKETKIEVKENLEQECKKIVNSL